MVVERASNLPVDSVQPTTTFHGKLNGKMHIIYVDIEYKFSLKKYTFYVQKYSNQQN